MYAVSVWLGDRWGMRLDPNLRVSQRQITHRDIKPAILLIYFGKSNAKHPGARVLDLLGRPGGAMPWGGCLGVGSRQQAAAQWVWRHPGTRINHSPGCLGEIAFPFW
ncbi:hypothetical protein Taro_040200 [Colocasia esculenta]|uniref:Uncharacterized protein n=1 Tax=Colocasia esculenta TaxID=4460 RepID=A0A843WPK7_COLES|nr:hypothetical protein [Colocasia esculenta]